MTMPVTMPETVTYSIDLPFPISANRLWRHASQAVHTRRGTYLSVPRVHLSPEYKSWIREADALFLAQKRRIGPVRTLGHYTLSLAFAREKRSLTADSDNLIKCVNDWLERVELVHNDSLCDGGTWTWGFAPAGCRAVIEGCPWTS